MRAAITYNTRLQRATLAYRKGSTELLELAYGYTQNGGNNGEITSITDNTGASGAPEAGRSVTYTYDSLHRLTRAVTTGSTSYPKWGLRWSYDRYGNRTAQTGTYGFPPENSAAVSTTTNRITTSGYTYDSSGNLTADALNTMTYDAENRAATNTQGSVTTTYVYDGNALRVRKCAPTCTSPTSSTVYIFAGSQVIAEYVNGAAVNSPTSEYIYLGSQLLAIENGGTRYPHRDHLSARVLTDSSGTKVGEQGHFPYGEDWYLNGLITTYLFTNYAHEPESGNDYAINRSHSCRLGRFTTADPVRGGISNPQRLNRYAYVMGNPINRRDPKGLFPRDVHEFMTFFLGAMLGRSDAAALATGVAAQDNFFNAATGLFGLGGIVNFDKHFGVPCTVAGTCKGGPFNPIPREIHLIQDNSPGGPHQIFGGYGLGRRILSEVAHAVMPIVGNNPDTDPSRRGTGFLNTWLYLGGTEKNYPGGAVNFALDVVAATKSKFVGVEITFANGTVASHGNVDLKDATPVGSKTIDGVEVEIWQLPGGYNIFEDPNVAEINRKHDLLRLGGGGSGFGSETARAMEIYEYMISFFW